MNADKVSALLNQIEQGAHVMRGNWQAYGTLDPSECSQLWTLFQRLDEECRRINGTRIKK